MRNFALAIMAASISTGAFAQDGDPERPSIIVLGTSTVERAPDRFRVVAQVDGRASTQVEALAQLASRQADVAESLSSLEGLTSHELTTGRPTVSPVRQADCESDYRSDEACPITGYLAASSVVLEGSPVERAGNAVSLAAERGATSATVQEFFLSASQELKAEAERAAFSNARAQAERLADASGQRIVRILRIQDPDVSRASRYGGLAVDVDELAEQVPLGRDVSRVALLAPRVSLAVTPQPVEVTARLVVEFEMD